MLQTSVVAEETVLQSLEVGHSVVVLMMIVVGLAGDELDSNGSASLDTAYFTGKVVHFPLYTVHTSFAW